MLFITKNMHLHALGLSVLLVFFLFLLFLSFSLLLSLIPVSCLSPHPQFDFSIPAYFCFLFCHPASSLRKPETPENTPFRPFHLVEVLEAPLNIFPLGHTRVKHVSSTVDSCQKLPIKQSLARSLTRMIPYFHPPSLRPSYI